MQAKGHRSEVDMGYHTLIKVGTGRGSSASVIPMPQDGENPKGGKGVAEVCKYHQKFHVGKEWILNVLSRVFKVWK